MSILDVQTKRVYEPPGPEDGKRILVDRLWPRGPAKEKAHLDAWMREAAPSPQLCTWFSHKPERFQEFRISYLKELAENPIKHEHVEQLYREATKGRVTLLYAAKHPTCNHAVVLEEAIRNLRP
ncbi:DUF488 domain-containing protein [Effusibacillus dendaii]|uniref:DUF488 domain-containing protein n=1 Tax=Effusibacillus dendaii TaxID=2743772 RepID=A0A7I8DF31_9BACL|nr:DUF488 family protein [Effusibacillus dendaii]BCJ87160.1 hypothetical protein skT53_21450 [Effusibacillus dendaii]